MSLLDDMIAYAEQLSVKIHGVQDALKRTYDARQELARLRRIEDAYRKDNLRGDGHKGEQWCERCERWCELSRTLIHASDCDVAIHLNLPREKGEGE